MLLFGGCATYKSYDYAEYHKSFSSDMSFYSQYEIIYKADTKRGNLVVAPFLANSNDYLPNQIIKLQYGLKVINPYRERFVVWIDYKFVEFDTNDELIRKSKLVYKSQDFPEEFISIDMPYITNIHSQIHFSVVVLGDNGILYKSTEALYKTKGSKL
jgi:hypothetical protein